MSHDCDNFKIYRCYVKVVIYAENLEFTLDNWIVDLYVWWDENEGKNEAWQI